MSRIIQLSELFGVSTDYLLKDNLEQAEPAGESSEESTTCRTVGMEEANAFLNVKEANSRRVALAVMLCILSPVALILLGAAQAFGLLNWSEEAACGAGLVIMMLLIVPAVGLFIISNLRISPYEYLEKEPVETLYGVTGLVKDRKEKFQPVHTRWLLIGIMLCVASVIPLFIAGMLSSENDLYVTLAVSVLLTVVALGVKIIVNTSVIWGSMDKLLEEGDYTRMNKKLSKYDGIYWMIMTAIYLAASFLTMRWDRTWIIWPVAGVLFAAYRELIKSRIGRY
jgi:hypothetical protein